MPPFKQSGRGGRLADPRALNRSLPSDSNSWTRLPGHGLSSAPPWPEEGVDSDNPPMEAEFRLWDRAWTEYPQAHLWRRNRQEFMVAAWVRTAIHCASGYAKAPMITALRQLQDNLLLNPHAMRAARVIIDEAIDEPIQEHTTTLGVAPVIHIDGKPHQPKPSALDRLQVASPAVADDEDEDDEGGSEEDYLS